MNYAKISKETIDLLYQSRLSLRKSPLDLATQTLVELRVSQINKCSYCCQLHSKEAQKLGVQQEKIGALPDWYGSSFFTDSEKIVFQWTESVTQLSENLEEIKKKLKKIYSEREVADLTICIGLMNALNRIVISLGK